MPLDFVAKFCTARCSEPKYGKLGLLQDFFPNMRVAFRGVCVYCSCACFIRILSTEQESGWQPFTPVLCGQGVLASLWLHSWKLVEPAQIGEKQLGFDFGS